MNIINLYIQHLNESMRPTREYIKFCKQWKEPSRQKKCIQGYERYHKEAKERAIRYCKTMSKDIKAMKKCVKRVYNKERTDKMMIRSGADYGDI